MNHQITNKPFRIGLLATGDEVVNGDILNTNGQTIAKTLVDQGFQIGLHTLVSDREAEIVAALHFLAQGHDAIITTGGLGPTSDDRTRYAIATFLQQPLVFDEASWQHVIQRLQKLHIAIHDSNRQQALFPANASIFPNPYGTASGCKIPYQQQRLYMLPGPPHECLPMFEQYVLPDLLATATTTRLQYYKWRLLGVIEADIAAKMDELLKNFPCQTGYRLEYPYVEFKLYSDDQQRLPEILKLVNQSLAPYHVNAENLPASEVLRRYLANSKDVLVIDDQATGGHLAANLITPETRSALSFDPRQAKPRFIITGLTEYWQNRDDVNYTTAIISDTEQAKDEQLTIPLRGKLTPRYVVEYIALALNRRLINQNNHLSAGTNTD